ncbi:Hydroxyethylthiazole kinase [Clostridium sp. N3C]|uniref:hydroxyethylthiazole kinase n=1 Tax=Clostridium sp. N3C TaxID=1776758 RepID=UPI00092DF510|nr:hydroxyethylthiazole kinase [Clostridium sp. N3C]SCN24031.1 Hydroxyethylthiazole kinase [Clostridium sp. N3C]
MNTVINTCAAFFNEIRKKNPLIHNITNYVTVNDCANAVLAIGASPIMADDIAEVEEIASMSSALVINIGTLNQRTITSMIKAAKKANEINIPVVLDPVGAGASTLRNKAVEELLSQVKIDVIRGNLSELSFIAGFGVSTKGVDASESDEKYNALDIAKLVCDRYSSIVGITGKIDIISDGNRYVKVANGHKLLSKVTGTGCMTSALVASFCGVTKDFYAATVAGIAAMGIAGEFAYEKAGRLGTGSFRNNIIDALSHMNSTYFLERVKIDEEKY